MGWGWKYTLSGGDVCHHPLLNTQNHCEKPKKIFCFSDRSYRNRKSHKIWGHLEAIYRVLEMIFSRGGVEHPPSLIGLSLIQFWIFMIFPSRYNVSLASGSLFICCIFSCFILIVIYMQVSVCKSQGPRQSLISEEHYHEVNIHTPKNN